MLANDALKAATRGNFKGLNTIVGKSCRQKQRRGWCYTSLQTPTTNRQRLCPQITAIHVETIEDCEPWRPVTLLQQLETRSFFVIENDNFAVETKSLWFQSAHRCRDCWIASSAVDSVSRK